MLHKSVILIFRSRTDLIVTNLLVLLVLARATSLKA